MSQKSLLSYFTKSPGPPKPEKIAPQETSRTPLKMQNGKSPKGKSPFRAKAKTPSSKTPAKRIKKSSSPKENEVESTVEEFQFKTPNKSSSAKKKLIVEEEGEESADISEGMESFDDSDSGDEFVPEGSSSDDDDSLEVTAIISEEEMETEEESPIKSTNNKRKRSDKVKPNKRKMTNRASNSRPAPKSNKSLITNTPACPPELTSSSISSGDTGNWSYLKFDFLKPEKIKDGKGRRPNDPNFDPKTLYIPQEFLKSQTPGMRQWWDIKKTNFDCILFFKIGKFYEFHHMDAVVGVKELSLTFMKGEYAHCGFPEIAFGRFSANLVDKGYKVARVEQVETPDMMSERVKKMHAPTKFDKVVKRELCQLTTKGTRIFTVTCGEAKEAQFSYLLAIAEKELDNIKSCYGVCFVDTSIGTFHVAQFSDDRHSSKLRTLLATYPPVQVLYERNRLSKRTHQILNTVVAGTLKESLAPETEFWTSSDTLLKLAERKYFPDGALPEPLKSFIGESDTLGLTASGESEMAIRSLGAITWFLTRSLLDYQLLSMAHFEIYTPINITTLSSITTDTIPPLSNRNMILDAVSLKNLNVIEGNGGLKGSLLHRIDHCCTTFGKRLLRQWLCSPLISIESIKARQNAVKSLKENNELLEKISTILCKVPDLERLFSRIYAQSSKGLQDSHPDNRAIMFEEKTYSKRKIIEFISVLNGFQTLQEVACLIQENLEDLDSEMLVDCTHFSTSKKPGSFPDLQADLQFFNEAFDHEEAEREGRIIPSAGVDTEYDNSIETLNRLDSEFKEYLKEQCKLFNCKVQYVGTDRRRFQLEIPESAAKKVTSTYELSGQRKGFKKYMTPTTKDLLERQIAAEEVKISLLQQLTKRMFAKFAERYSCWNAAINCIATLDVLMSLAKYALSIEGDLSQPILKECNNSQKPFVNITNGKYPCITCEDNFIPNDTKVGGESAAIMLLTGPNMGGKSTLMRQVSLLIILAQMGSYVPAEDMALTCVDRIFTRIGANDDIISGDSTFYLELCETSAILSYATPHSLVLIDELGRGTSTYDGTAIAASVLNELCRTSCRTIFSTHYHTLVGSFKGNETIKLAHMSCMAETDEESDDGKEEMVTFLYKLASGACPKSYGFNAARLAGVPSYITRLGSSRAKLLEEEANNRKLFRAIFTSDNPREFIAAL